MEEEDNKKLKYSLKKDTSSFALDTKSTCFLCLNQVSSKVSHDSENSTVQIEKGKRLSLHSVCRYLKIKFGEVLENELAFKNKINRFKETEQGLIKGELSKLNNVSVTLCQDCNAVVGKFSDVAMELELAQKKMKACLKQLHGVLEKSDGDNGHLLGQFWNHIGTERGKIWKHGKLLEKMRSEIKEKSNKTLNCKKPKTDGVTNPDTSLEQEHMTEEMETGVGSPKIINTFTQSQSVEQFGASLITTFPQKQILSSTANVTVQQAPLIYLDDTDDEEEETFTTHTPEEEQVVMVEKEQPVSTTTVHNSPLAYLPQINYCDPPENLQALLPSSVLSLPSPSSLNRSWKCNICFKAFKNRTNLHRHHLNGHGQTNPLDRNCSLCNLKFRYTADWINHVKNECPYLYAENLEDSTSGVGGASQKKFICTLCTPNLTMNTKRGSRQHKIRNHVETLLTSHKLEHLSMREFKEYCDHAFQMEILLSDTGLNLEGNPCVKCSHCEKSYSNHYTLWQHLYEVHEDVMVEKLVELQLSSTLEEILSIDLPAFSFPENVRWKCGACGATFAQDTSLYKHRKHKCVHRFESKLEDLTCEICQKVCASTQSKVVHKRRVHPQHLKVASTVTNDQNGAENSDMNVGTTEEKEEDKDNMEDVAEEGQVNDADRQEEMTLPVTSPNNTEEKEVILCTFCKPACQVPVENIKLHQINNHPETLFDADSCKLPDLSMAQFKVYCEHYLAMEIASCKKELNDRLGTIYCCSYCSKRYGSSGGLLLHLFSDHEEIVSEKLVELQETKSEQEINTSLNLTSVAFGGTDGSAAAQSTSTRGSLSMHKKRIHATSGGNHKNKKVKFQQEQEDVESKNMEVLINNMSTPSGVKRPYIFRWENRRRAQTEEEEEEECDDDNEDEFEVDDDENMVNVNSEGFIENDEDSDEDPEMDNRHYDPLQM